MSEYDSELSKIVAELNRAAPSQKTPGAPAGARNPPRRSTSCCAAAAARNASDVLLIAGAPADAAGQRRA